MEDQSYALPDLSSTTPTDFQLLEEHLRPSRQRYMSERNNVPGGVNRRLPLMDPWELPGMPPDNEAGKRGKYFLTDCPDLLYGIFEPKAARAPQGFWQPRSMDRGWGIRDESNPSRFAGMRKTYYFHTGRRPLRGGTNTNWVMKVYFLLGQDNYTQDELVLCRVFENNSPDYDPPPKCAAFHQPANGEGKPLSTHPVTDQTLQLESTSYQELCSSSSDQTSKLNSYIEGLKNLLLGEPDTSTDIGTYDARGGGENGPSRKRPRTSPVWDSLTKIFKHGPDGVVVTFAICNHCCKVLTGVSKNGTSHLGRHTRQCNHESKFSKGGCYRETPPPPSDPPTPLVPSPMDGGCGGTHRGPLPPPPHALADGQRMRGLGRN